MRGKKIEASPAKSLGKQDVTDQGSGKREISEKKARSMEMKRKLRPPAGKERSKTRGMSR